jgi:NADPH-dependent glutamate synthase beta subunit-like oxidoreductase
MKNSRLADLIRERGFNAEYEYIYDVTDAITKERVQRKPDVVFWDGGTHLVSAKDGEQQERESIATAIQYLRDLSSITQVGEVFALTYTTI